MNFIIWILQNLAKGVEVKAMFSDKTNGHPSSKKLYYFSFGYVRFYVVCAVFYL